MIKFYSALLVIALCGTIPAAAMDGAADSLEFKGSHKGFSLLYASCIRGEKEGDVQNGEKRCVDILSTWHYWNRNNNDDATGDDLKKRLSAKCGLFKFLPWFVEGKNNVSREVIQQLSDDILNGDENGDENDDENDGNQVLNDDQVLNIAMNQALKKTKACKNNKRVLTVIQEIANSEYLEYGDKVAMPLLKGGFVENVGGRDGFQFKHCKGSLQRAFFISVYSAFQYSQNLSEAFESVKNFEQNEVYKHNDNDDDDPPSFDEDSKIAFPLLVTLMVGSRNQLENVKIEGSTNWGDEQLAALAGVNDEVKLSFIENLKKFRKGIEDTDEKKLSKPDCDTKDEQIQDENHKNRSFFYNFSLNKIAAFVAISFVLYGCYKFISLNKPFSG